MPASALRGVSLRFLSEFASKVPQDLSTGQVVAKYIAPKCGGLPFTSLVSAKYTGPAQHYVIHAHSCCFLSDLVVPLLQHFIGDPSSDPALRSQLLSSTFVWLDVFCAPQQPPPSASSSSSPLAARCGLVDAALRQASSALLLLDSGAAALGRTWCLYEVARALVLLGPQRLHVPIFEFSLDIIHEALQTLHVGASEASDPADQRALLAALSAAYGGGDGGGSVAGPAAGSPSRSGSGLGGEAGAPGRRSPRLVGPLGAANKAIVSGIQDSLVSEAQQLIRAGLRSGPRYLACLRKAAEALRLGRAPLAEALAEAALKVLDGRRRVLGPDSPDTAAACDQLAWCLHDAGRLEEAAELYREALRISCRALGDDHPDTASSTNNLAGVLQSLGRLEEAEPLLKRSLDVTIRTLGANHPHTATNYNNLGVLYRSRGQLAEASAHFAAAYDITLAVLGPEHPDCITSCNNLVHALRAEGRLREAEQLLRQATEGAAPPASGMDLMRPS
ncbi:hypothetical protein GPECTOR_9g610 [Gonium pectorale]|uniref:Uncharacterized protein n=1 Tax=Gonium pectorale TaxID=33097 RepID=A0A150GRS1_GONPE|nr:hypothetical protein GPECTOR_9g610 [Gonium pectorale]|eukprot:KXZ52566.1 hypothetical protein GPECTOR_9g610 [Gonium pectorale]